MSHVIKGAGGLVFKNNHMVLMMVRGTNLMCGRCKTREI